MAGVHDSVKQDVGSFMLLNGQGYEGWTSKTSASKDEVVLGKLILGFSQKGRKGDNQVHGKDLDLDPFNSSLEDTLGYQSDADWNNLERLQGEIYGSPRSRNPAVKRLLDMEPLVQCRDNFMTLQVKGGLLGSSLMVDGGDGSLLPLSQLPSHCGYSVKTTWRDMVFTAPYDGCYGIQEGGSHVLPLRWLGAPMKMACPHHPSTIPASVACYPSGMVVKIDAPQAVASELNIKFKNEWKPLLSVSAQCGYSIVTHPGGLVITAPFTPCDETKDGMHTIEILEGKIKLSCPSPAANVASVVDFVTARQPGTPVPAYPQAPKPAPATAAPWSPGFVFPQAPKPAPATAAPWSPGFVFPQAPKPAPATAAPWSPGFVFPQAPKPAPATAAPWSPGFVFPQAPKPVPATAAPWSPGFVFPQAPKPALATAAPWPPGFVYPQPLKPILATATTQPTPAYSQPSKPAPATAAPWSPGFVFPQAPKPAPATAAPWSPGFVFPQAPKPAPATAAPWSPGFVFPQAPKPAPATAAPWSPGFVFPQAPKPAPATAAPWSPGFVFPQAPKPAPATAAPWPPGFVYPQPLKPILATATTQPTPAYSQPSKPAPATAAPWSPGFVFPQAPKPAPATAAPWSPGFVFPQAPKPAPATAAPWSPGFVFPQAPKPAPATAAPRPAPAYPKPETDTLPPYPSFNNPFPLWSVYLQTATSTLGPRHFIPPYMSRPPASYPCSHSNCWPLSYHQHNHLHLDSDNFDCAQFPALAGKPHPASSYAPPLPYSRQYNLQYASPSSKPLLSGSAIQLPTPALPPHVSRQAFQNYWDLVPLSSSRQSNHKGPSALHLTPLSQETDIPSSHPHLWPSTNNYWSATRPLYPAYQTLRQPVFSYHPAF